MCEAGALLDEVLSGCVASAQVVLHAGLCGFHLIDFDRLLRQLPPEVRDRLAALFDLCTGDLALVIPSLSPVCHPGRLGLFRLADANLRYRSRLHHRSTRIGRWESRARASTRRARSSHWEMARLGVGLRR